MQIPELLTLRFWGIIFGAQKPDLVEILGYWWSIFGIYQKILNMFAACRQGDCLASNDSGTRKFRNLSPFVVRPDDFLNIVKGPQLFRMCQDDEID